LNWFSCRVRHRGSGFGLLHEDIQFFHYHLLLQCTFLVHLLRISCCCISLFLSSLLDSIGLCACFCASHYIVVTMVP
jgi:hypothetical protein